MKIINKLIVYSESLVKSFQNGFQGRIFFKIERN